jgi:predicted HAD superfamily Cof-like phosphohydrolase
VSIPQQDAVAAFHRAMGAPAPAQPTPLSTARAALRVRLIEEEAAEFRDAVERADWYEMIDALVDLLYVTYGAAVEMGVDLEPFFEEVHQANLQKVPATDGGKSIKPGDWSPPDIAAVYARRYDAPEATE